MSEKKFDWDAAIVSHLKWKDDLKKYIEIQEDVNALDASVIIVDNQCHLGKHLYEYYLLNGEDEFVLSLIKEHANFHKSAGDLISLICEKGYNSPILSKYLLNYLSASDKIVSMLRTAKKMF